MRTSTSSQPSMDRLSGVTAGGPGGAPRPAWLDGDGRGVFGAGTGAVGASGLDVAGADVAGAEVADSDADRPQSPLPAGAAVRARTGHRERWAARVPDRWRGTRFVVGRRGAVVLAVVGLLAAAAAGVGVLRDRPAALPVPEIAPATVALDGADPTGAGAPGGTAAGRAEPSSGAAAASAPGETAPAGERAAAVPEEIVVSVQGLVHHGGLVRLERGARVADALNAAGGPTEGADLLSLNLAQRLDDGDQVLVGVAPEDGGAPRLGSATIPAGSAGTGGGSASASGSGAAAGAPVDLNTANRSALEALPGVGPVTAESILQWREQNGRFASVDQLTEVRGIGPATLERLRDAVTV
ncbi:helix-hairpin-helix domain-containing protein [Tomitella gaofuii]|uniref:helix-hairpin-helix domain-containing protein n=1 Tax=Tomitella gaofuii TaxID=2760083 RepID=UPI0015FC03FB|nr:helix-hairpin-helix domain-containing protein [Tomitella gaofuii]